MKVGTVAACLALVAPLSMGCNPATRYTVLSFFFDGVPPPAPPGPPPGTAAAGPGAAVANREVGYREHGPYAARLCSACHESAATNALVVPREQLCFRCHDFKLDKRYVHGPLASGGCLACHDPHSSQYRYFLVSASDTFCLRCHDRDAVAKRPAHAGTEERCTACHDPHMSDKKYLLR